MGIQDNKLEEKECVIMCKLSFAFLLFLDSLVLMTMMGWFSFRDGDGYCFPFHSLPFHCEMLEHCYRRLRVLI